MRAPLRALTRYSEAVAVIQTAAIKAPKDFDVLGEYGKASGLTPVNCSQAKDVLSHAYTPDNPRWDVMSVQGVRGRSNGRSRERHAILSRSFENSAGRAERAHQHGAFARLAKKLPEAEKALKQAVASPKADARMRGDLALVLALEGKFDEAEEVGLTDLSPEAARANVEAIRQMIAQNDSWRELRKPAEDGEAEDAGQKPRYAGLMPRSGWFSAMGTHPVSASPGDPCPLTTQPFGFARARPASAGTRRRPGSRHAGAPGAAR